MEAASATQRLYIAVQRNDAVENAFRGVHMASRSG